jgi:hypothetical protein
MKHKPLIALLTLICCTLTAFALRARVQTPDLTGEIESGGIKRTFLVHLPASPPKGNRCRSSSPCTEAADRAKGSTN